MPTLTAYIEKDPETGLYVAIVPGIPGAHTQAETLDELQENLKEVLEMCLEEMEPENKQQLPQFVGIQQVQRVRQKGSHVFYRHLDGRTTSVPYHPGRDLARPLIKEILREIELSVEEYNEYLKKL